MRRTRTERAVCAALLNIITLIFCMLFGPASRPERRRALIESLFKQRSTLDRLQSGPLAQYLPSIADALHQEQYPPETIRRYVRVADGLGRWLGKHGLSLAEADETILARYLGHAKPQNTYWYLTATPDLL